MLIGGDKYGGVGKDNKLLSALATSLRVIAKETKNRNEILQLQKEALKNVLTTRFASAKTKETRIRRLIADLEKEIENDQDMEVFILTCENVMLPINQAIENIPSDDKDFTQAIARSFLNIQGEKGLARVINLWDDLGVKGCLTAERTEIVKAFATLRILLSRTNEISEHERDIILTAFAQEFERRAGQKRKGRAGGSLEDVTSFILDYFAIRSSKAPEHFQADIEVDKWVRTKDGWLIGISCKRTIRERWKQVSSAEGTVLSKFKIKHIYHVITFDEDLSDEKLTLLGGLRHVFYLPDTSRILAHASQHVGLKDYVRPMSHFIRDLRNEVS